MCFILAPENEILKYKSNKILFYLYVENLMKEIKEHLSIWKSLGKLSQLVRVASQYAKVLGWITSQGTYKKAANQCLKR